ncbi:Crp/Fnr family transcriptional regulator [Patescibacteria group bacterium]|nr:Crp/Fnr family transcriptional regulator [Patescibacteria group bacterium]
MATADDKIQSRFRIFFQNGTTCIYKKGEVIVAAEREPAGVYLIESGYITVYSLTNQGEEKVRIIYKRGELFPFIWVFRGSLRPVYYQAMTDVRLKRVRRTAFLDFIRQDADLLSHALERTVSVLAAYADRVDNLGRTDAYSRVIHRLLTLADRFGRPAGTRVTIPVPLTHHDIANSTNMTRETASRQLERLQKEKLITYRNRRLVLTDLEKLRDKL